MQFFTSSLVILTSFFFTHIHSYEIVGVTTNVNSETGERPSRQNLATFESSGPIFDLYIQALERFQSTDENELLSYYQVAGIHGRPFEAWDDVQGDNDRGYCTHGSIIFPTWHRPYLALFEQILANHTQTIAEEYPDDIRQEYEAAANEFRIPYWDWAASATIPESLTSPNITINAFNGSRTLENPLHHYRFRSDRRDTDFPSSSQFQTDPTTLRASDAEEFLGQNGANLRDSTFNLLTSQPDYAPFSNNAFSENRGNRFSSIEGIHDLVHSAIGGWMGQVPYSAFDPIFWLHHANVDRLFAIWQAIYPDSYVTSQENRLGTFTTDAGTEEDVNTSLTPFRTDNENELHTSVIVRSTRFFGYTVPEVRDWEEGRNISEATLARVRELYGPEEGTDLEEGAEPEGAGSEDDTDPEESTEPEEGANPEEGAEPEGAGSEDDTDPEEGTEPEGGANPEEGAEPEGAGSEDDTDPEEGTEPEEGADPAIRRRSHSLAPKKRQDLSVTGGAFTVPSKLISEDEVGSYRNWFANVVVNKFALDDPFYVHIFIGDVPEGPASWFSGVPSFVGTFAVFSNARMGGKIEPVVVNYGQVPLNRRLIELFNEGEIDDLEVDTVSPYLADNLQWRAQRYDRTEIPVEDLESLSVFVVSGVVDSSASAAPLFRELEAVPEITMGRTGGADDLVTFESDC